MADEVTAASVASITNAEWINPAFQATARDQAVATAFAYEKNLQGKGSNKVSFPKIVNAAGSPGDHGGGVDTEFDAVEVTEPANTALTLDDDNVQSGEYICVRELGDTAQEDSLEAFDLMFEIQRDTAAIVTLAKEDDVITLFSTFTNVKGTSGAALTFQNMSDCIAQLRRDGIKTPAGPGGLAFILSGQQGVNYEDAQTATGASQAQYQMTAERALKINPDVANGLINRALGTFKGHVVFDSGLTDTANAGVDDVGACIVRGDIVANQPYAAVGAAISREVRMEPERHARKRTWDVVVTARSGYGVINPNAGVQLVTVTG